MKISCRIMKSDTVDPSHRLKIKIVLILCAPAENKFTTVASWCPPNLFSVPGASEVMFLKLGQRGSLWMSADTFRILSLNSDCFTFTGVGSIQDILGPASSTSAEKEQRVPNCRILVVGPGGRVHSLTNKQCIMKI